MARNGRPRRPRAERGGVKPRLRASPTITFKKHAHYQPVSTSIIRDAYGPAVERALASWERELMVPTKKAEEWVEISDLPRSNYRVEETVDGWKVFVNYDR